jgi:hypothetical protein
MSKVPANYKIASNSIGHFVEKWIGIDKNANNVLYLRKSGQFMLDTGWQTDNSCYLDSYEAAEAALAKYLSRPKVVEFKLTARIEKIAEGYYLFANTSLIPTIRRDTLAEIKEFLDLNKYKYEWPKNLEELS